jgi:hypothetical protein
MRIENLLVHKHLLGNALSGKVLLCASSFFLSEIISDLRDRTETRHIS